MALSKFGKDMAIIAALDDEPNDVGGLTASELKAKFDEGGEALKAYLNETLLPQLERLGVEAALLLPTGAGFKYIRLNADQVLEVSPDGAAWQASGSSGHLILDKDGAELPQRSRMKFMNGTVADEDGVTVVYGAHNNSTPADIGAFGFVRILTSADDLDNIKAIGAYVYYTGDAPANCPYPNAGVVEVVATNHDNGRLIQRVTRYGVGGNTAFRVMDSGKWLDWAKVSVEGHTHGADTIQAGTLASGVKASTGTDYTAMRLRNIMTQTADVTAGTTGVSNGNIILVYE